MNELIADLRALLVLLAAAGLWIELTYVLHAWRREGWRMAGLQAATWMAVCVWLILEGLGAFRWIATGTVLVAWAIAAALGTALFIRAWRAGLQSETTPTWTRLKVQAVEFRPLEAAGLAFIGASVIVLGVIAFAAAPNTWDGLTYHLSRVMHWQQDRSLAFYATAIQRQLAYGPLAEMEILTAQLLAGSDRLANFAQYGAMMGCLLGGSLIAEELGGGRRAQLLAAVLTLTVPMGILQATSTQNDYVAAFWCVAFVVFMLRYLRVPPSAYTSVLVGGALGLAILTKATTLLYLPAFGLWLAAGLLRGARLIGLRHVLIVLGAALVILAPQSWRNYRLFGDPLGARATEAESPVSNDELGAGVLASNLLRNLGSELAVPSAGINNALGDAVLYAHRLLHVDANDPRTTWPGTQYHVLFTTHEDSASSPLDVLVVMTAAVLLFKSPKRDLVLYLCCLAGGLLLFCLVLKWQPWTNRLIFPLLVLAIPFAAAVLADVLPRPWLALLTVVFAGIAIPYLLLNPSRPLLGASSVLTENRARQYFTNVPDSFDAYDAVARRISDAQCKQVGLVTRVDGREYLAWVMVRAYTPDARLEHVQVRNASRELLTDFSPCAIIVFNSAPSGHMTYQNTSYDRVLSEGGLDLFLVAGSG